MVRVRGGAGGARTKKNGARTKKMVRAPKKWCTTKKMVRAPKKRTNLIPFLCSTKSVIAEIILKKDV
jgi:hypothetical protein